MANPTPSLSGGALRVRQVFRPWSAWPGPADGELVSTCDVLVVARGGHRRLPHSTDVIVSAWAPTRDECVEQAVRGMVSCFAEVTRRAPDQTVQFSLSPDSDGALLVGVLEEAIFTAHARGLIPVRTHLWSTGGGEVRGEFDVLPGCAVHIHGRVPKAVTLNQLSLHAGGAWRCKITVDV